MPNTLAGRAVAAGGSRTHLCLSLCVLQALRRSRLHYVLPTSSVWLLLWSFCCRIPVLRLWGPISNLSGLIGSSTYRA